MCVERYIRKHCISHLCASAYRACGTINCRLDRERGEEQSGCISPRYESRIGARSDRQDSDCLKSLNANPGNYISSFGLVDLLVEQIYYGERGR